MEKTKICFKCGRELPLSHFYKHRQMKDGHLNKCIDCTKIDTYKRYSILSNDENYIEKERKRGRDKYKRLYRLKKTKKTTDICQEEKLISRKLKMLNLYKNGYEAHHWNYNFPKSVILLPIKVHKLIHKYIFVNYEDKICYTLGGFPLDTKEKSEKYYNDIIEDNGIDLKVSFIDL